MWINFVKRLTGFCERLNKKYRANAISDLNEELQDLALLLDFPNFENAFEIIEHDIFKRDLQSVFIDAVLPCKIGWGVYIPPDVNIQTL